MTNERPPSDDEELVDEELVDEAAPESADATAAEPVDEGVLEQAPDAAEDDLIEAPDAAEEEREPEPVAPTAAPGPKPSPSRVPATKAGPAAAREVGYRGSLPPRDDRIARPWVLAVAAIFVLILLLAWAGLPSRLIPEPTPAPVPSFSLEPLPSASVLTE
jgi:hypothetical protein